MLKNVHPLALLALILVAILLLFVACDDEVVYAPSPVPVSQVQPQVIQQPAPVVVAAPAASHDGFLTGLIAGHLMSGNNGGNNVVHRTTIINSRSAKRSFFGTKSRTRSYSTRSSFRRR